MSTSVVLRQAATWSLAILLSGPNQPRLGTLTVGGLNAALLSSASAATYVTSVTSTFANVVAGLLDGLAGQSVLTSATPTTAFAVNGVSTSTLALAASRTSHHFRARNN
jgi:hypothetical protein